jgi:hypothetical protein
MKPPSDRRVSVARRVSQGDNFSIDIGPTGVVECVVWKRPDLSWAEGARFAALFADGVEALARAEGTAFVVDLSEAPPLFGPRTEEALARAFASVERAGKALAVVIGSVGMQKLQLERVLRERAPLGSRTFTELAAARAWARSELRGLDSESGAGPRSRR